MIKSIFLVGPMGSGKTEVGSILARRLGLEFIDTDKLVEEREGFSVEEIFEQHGEDHFREIERSVIAEVARKSGVVVSSGGGTVLLDENVEAMRNSGTVIYLEVDALVAAQRVGPGLGRPLLQDGDVEKLLRKIIDERQTHYLSAAHHVLSGEGLPEEVTERILEVIS